MSKENTMSVQELFVLLQSLIARGNGDYLILIQDEDDEVYPLQDATIHHAQDVVLLQLDTRPMELR
jgi:hypothetical protein